MFHPGLPESFFWAGGKFIYNSGEEAPGFSLLQKYPDGWEIKDGKPELILCPADVGRRVRLEDGTITLLTRCTKDGNSFGSCVFTWNKFGEVSGDPKYNIKELLA